MNATNFDAREIQNNVSADFKPVTLIGKCKRCRKPARFTDVQPGRATFTRDAADTIYVFAGANQPAFRLASGEIVQAYSLAWHSGFVATCAGCASHFVAVPVVGRFVAEKKCDGRCMGATGPNCDCSCGGKNHGCAHG